MKKTNLTIFTFVCFFVLLLIMSSSIVSAGFFSDLFGKLFGKKVFLSPENETCIDNDGINYYIKGTLTNSSGSFNDFCRNTNSLQELYCNGNISMYELKECSSLGNYSCSNGACVREGCTDSDGGTNYYNPGIATSNNGGVINGSMDYCASSSALIEFYCSSGKISSTSLNCTIFGNYICSDGACVLANQCTDSDGGLNLTIQGTVTNKWGINFTDSCYGDTLQEFSCSSNGIHSIHNELCTSLGSDYICSDGACVQNQTNITVECYSDNDCPNAIYNYCNGTQRCTDITSYTCQNPGTAQSQCVANGGGHSCENCEFGCSDGTCISNQTNQTQNQAESYLPNTKSGRVLSPQSKN